MPEPTDTVTALLAAALEAREQAYAPYSRFPVGAAVLGESGRIYSGCNVENAAYPQGWCAETSAIAALIRGGERRVLEVAVVATGHSICTPCGGCRQTLLEFASPRILVHACSPDGVRRTFTLEELQPHGFGPNLLPEDTSRR